MLRFARDSPLGPLPLPPSPPHLSYLAASTYPRTVVAALHGCVPLVLDGSVDLSPLLAEMRLLGQHPATALALVEDVSRGERARAGEGRAGGAVMLCEGWTDGWMRPRGPASLQASTACRCWRARVDRARRLDGARPPTGRSGAVAECRRAAPSLTLPPCPPLCASSAGAGALHLPLGSRQRQRRGRRGPRGRRGGLGAGLQAPGVGAEGRAGPAAAGALRSAAGTAAPGSRTPRVCMCMCTCMCVVRARRDAGPSLLGRRPPRPTHGPAARRSAPRAPPPPPWPSRRRGRCSPGTSERPRAAQAPPATSPAPASPSAAGTCPSPATKQAAGSDPSEPCMSRPCDRLAGCRAPSASKSWRRC
jgi:hypothetical protein